MVGHHKTAVSRVQTLGLALFLSLGLWPGAQAVDAELLAEELEALTERAQALEQSLSEATVAADQRELREPHHDDATRALARLPADGSGNGSDNGSDNGAMTGTERAAELDALAEEPPVRIGGALRFNLVHRSFSDASDTKFGETGFDLFRFNVEGQIDNLLISAEYRHYSFMQTIRYGWIGYEFGDGSQLQFGIHQVPFGLLPFAAHNAWFGVPYYVGLADNYDMGIKLVRGGDSWQGHFAFYKNEELNDATDLDRYGFDLVRVDNQQNEEINRVNARFAWDLGLGTGCEHEIGASMQVAQLYNATTNRRGDHWALASHLDTRCGRWALQLQGVHYSYNPENPDGVSDETVRLGAFGTSYDIDAKADIMVANVAYNLDPPWERIDQLVCYNDYSRLIKSLDDARDSQINTLGCAIGVGPLFTYVDLILANNMPFFANGSLAGGGENRWRTRFNVNIGYYW